jgi:hypothetical protein
VLSSTSPADAAELTRLMETHRPFSFLRLGDGELRFLLQCQTSGATEEPRPIRVSCEVAHGDPGLRSEHYARLLHSFEGCQFLDLYTGLPYNRENLPRLQWKRDPRTLGEAHSGEVGLLFTWAIHELRGYLSRHRVVVCGAEAALLRELLAEPRYREIVASLWPGNAETHFVEPLRGGAHLADDLDAIKAQLEEAIRIHRADTVLLSLGGAAKILAFELATELGIRVVDSGSLLRALTYSGSDGQAAWRAPHHPFLVRVPLDLFLSGLRRANPRMDRITLVAKAHAQLCLDLQRKVEGHSITADANDGSVFDPSPENLAHYNQSLRTYRAEVLPLAREDAECTRLAREFRYWRWKKGLGWDGRLFRLAVATKRQFRRLTKRGA